MIIVLQFKRIYRKKNTQNKKSDSIKAKDFKLNVNINPKLKEKTKP